MPFLYPSLSILKIISPLFLWFSSNHNYLYPLLPTCLYVYSSTSRKPNREALYLIGHSLRKSQGEHIERKKAWAVRQRQMKSAVSPPWWTVHYHLLTFFSQFLLHERRQKACHCTQLTWTRSRGRRGRLWTVWLNLPNEIHLCSWEELIMYVSMDSETRMPG